MQKQICKLPQPLVDALLYQGYRQPGRSDDYYQLVVNTYADWLRRAYAPYNTNHI